jgi:hypothetical protein
MGGSIVATVWRGAVPERTQEFHSCASLYLLVYSLFLPLLIFLWLFRFLSEPPLA